MKLYRVTTDEKINVHDESGETWCECGDIGKADYIAATLNWREQWEANGHNIGEILDETERRNSTRRMVDANADLIAEQRQQQQGDQYSKFPKIDFPPETTTDEGQ